MSEQIGIIGLGYVGLQLAVAFGEKLPTIGYDLSARKIDDYRKHLDVTGEVSTEQFQRAQQLAVTNDIKDLSDCDVLIVAVPTPVDGSNKPDLSPLIAASRSVGEIMKSGSTVVYESTVYPGATEEVCVPELEQESGLVWKKDFNVGYSPERINPGDMDHTLQKIVKVVSGDTPETLARLTRLYEKVVAAGIHQASSIKVAEAAKVIENTQRDINIAFVNELAVVFDRVGIDTAEVLEAAQTKWNFLKFTPGLVGGHCIGVDPYYLTDKAKSLGYEPEVILAGRRINDSMGTFLAQKTAKMVLSNGLGAHRKVAVLGMTFKENCTDLRNSQSFKIVDELQEYGFDVKAYDPVVNADEAKGHYGIDLCEWEELRDCSAIVLAVAHDSLVSKAPAEYAELLVEGGIAIDVKRLINRDEFIGLGYRYWAL
jgi:UDP-N-acetyl-D-galactosamine dehydrogenase